MMWFNSKQREEPYQGLTSSDRSRDRASLRGRVTGGAWLSSARVVRCLVKSNNERNPYGQLPAFSWALWQDCRGSTRRKEGTTSNHHAPYVLGYTRNTMATTEGSYPARASESRKRCLSSDCRLQLACMKSELLVMAGQHTAVNTFPGLVHTARHTMRVCNTRSQ